MSEGIVIALPADTLNVQTCGSHERLSASALTEAKRGLDREARRLLAVQLEAKT